MNAIMNQKDQDVICVYSDWAKASTITRMVNQLERFGAMDYTVVVASPADDIPFTVYCLTGINCRILMEQGKDVLSFMMIYLNML